MVYRWLLRLYPSDFRRLYQQELEADFDASCREARDSGDRRALLRCYLDTAVDLATSVPREWLRTPWLASLGAAAIVASAVFYYVVIRVYRARSFAGVDPPESPELIWLMAAMVLVPIAVMFLIGIARVVSSRPHPRHRRA